MNVAHVAALAKIKLSEAEIKKFTPQLKNILDFFAQLQEVDTEGVPETSQVTGLENVMRRDDVEQCENQDDYIAGSPQGTEDHCIKIPKIM